MTLNTASAVLICSSRSVEGWWRAFRTLPIEQSYFWSLEEHAATVDAPSVLLELLSARPLQKVLVLSDYKSLSRDAVLVDRLRQLGWSVVGSGAQEVQLELDKVAAKSFLHAIGVPTPAWGREPTPGTPQLVKKRRSSEGAGVDWYTGQPLLPGDYLEKYVHGDEYSVNLVVHDRGFCVLPIVSKGATREELTPPFRRVRTCGPGDIKPEVENLLLRYAQLIGSAYKTPGFLEIEFVVCEAGAFAFEINARISGTTKMAALSVPVPFLDLVEGAVSDILSPTRCVVEFPVEARGDESILGPDVLATSRMTISGRTWDDVRRKVGKAVAAGWQTTSNEWVDLNRKLVAREGK